MDLGVYPYHSFPATDVYNKVKPNTFPKTSTQRVNNIDYAHMHDSLIARSHKPCARLVVSGNPNAALACGACNHNLDNYTKGPLYALIWACSSLQATAVMWIRPYGAYPRPRNGTANAVTILGIDGGDMVA